MMMFDNNPSIGDVSTSTLSTAGPNSQGGSGQYSLLNSLGLTSGSPSGSTTTNTPKNPGMIFNLTISKNFLFIISI